jgi:polyisoprenoid-binding protein YceI
VRALPLLALACACATPRPAPRGPGVESLAIRPAGSYIRFSAARVGARHIGELRRFTGAVELVDGGLLGSRIIVDIDMRSLEADVPALAAHLRSPDFFDVERYPNAVFASTLVTADHARGTLELRGRRRAIQFPVVTEIREREIVASGRFLLDRRAFGIDHPGIPWDRADDMVAVEFRVEAARTAP